MESRIVALDEQRGLAERRMTAIRRRLAEVAAEDAGMDRRQKESGAPSGVSPAQRQVPRLIAAPSMLRRDRGELT